MKVINIKNLMLQFDADRTTTGGDLEQAQSAVDQINTVLQTACPDLAPQLMVTAIDDDDVSSDDDEEEDEDIEEKDEEDPHRYTNRYVCPTCKEDDGESVWWDDDWSCMCNDECPECGKEIQPTKSWDHHNKDDLIEH